MNTKYNQNQGWTHPTTYYQQNIKWTHIHYKTLILNNDNKLEHLQCNAPMLQWTMMFTWWYEDNKPVY